MSEFENQSDEILTKASATLRKWGNGGTPKDVWMGICGNLARAISIGWTPYIGILSTGWPQYSGVYSTPVPHPDFPDAAEGYEFSEDKWSGEYGELRRSLCRYIADKIDAELQRRDAPKEEA